MITLLDQNTINKIAAGEVIERPSAVVKELAENAMDAGANSITIEIKEGGTSLIRITDNGGGMEGSEIALAFKRHATSKIKSVEDLMTVKSLGFRGEALSSIAAVSQLELVTKTPGALTGSRYIIEGGEEKSLEAIGCPEGTTFLVRNLFYNTPARRKFLKSSITEAGYIADLVERLAVSHPNISFKLIHNNQVKIQTTGNHNLKDIIYHIYGREITAQTVEISSKEAPLSIWGFIGKPLVSRGNRNYMNYFINGRYIKSNLINRAIEEAYKPYTMSHRYPFTVLLLEMDSALIDVNVHPTKMEVRFLNQEEVFKRVYDAVCEALKGKEWIPEITLEEETVKETERAISQPPLLPSKKETPERGPEPFEKNRIEDQRKAAANRKDSLLLREESVYIAPKQISLFKETNPLAEETHGEKLELKETGFLKEENKKEHRIIGQLFSTYWLVEYQDKLFLIDQHAAHEKVLFERTMKSIKSREFASQICNPPIIITLSMREEEIIKKQKSSFEQLGFEIESFGGKEYAVSAVPANLCNLAQKDLLLEIIDSLVSENKDQNSDILLEKIASMSCKAAVKGNMHLSEQEAHQLIDELMTLENPYHCPHGRPTIVSMSKYEIEKKFKRRV
ncbi:MAG: DNA mismatch repair endonuclease MutL [Acetivibrio sp.]